VTNEKINKFLLVSIDIAIDIDDLVVNTSIADVTFAWGFWEGNTCIVGVPASVSACSSLLAVASSP
jgi:hypothetical protein